MDDKSLKAWIKDTLEKQFSLDYNCSTSDFSNKDTLVTEMKERDGKRVSEEEGILSILSYNGKLVITASPLLLPWCKEVLSKRISAPWCFEAGSLISIDKKLSEFGYGIDQAHIFFTPSTLPEKRDEGIRVLGKEEIEALEEDERIDEAFLFEDYIEDVLGTAIYDGKDGLVAVAGATHNSPLMWELGVNSFREGEGYGAKVLSALIRETIEKGKVPFYGTALSHLSSQRLALKCGMVPTFTELTTIKL